MTTRLFKKMIWNHYRAHKRDMPWRRTKDPYRILVSEIMLQQTQVSRVMKFYPKFIKQFPSFRSIARAKTGAVLRAWQGLGYNRRALALQKLSKIVLEKFNGWLPRERAALESLPGIGKATAGALRAFAYNEPEIFIETNIRRVFIHFFFSRRPKVRLEKVRLKKVTDAELERYIKRTLDQKNPREWYWALMDYGASIMKTMKVGLKEHGAANPNKKSVYYRKQPRFSGSDRELRGKILKLLLQKGRNNKKTSFTMLSKTTGESIARVQKVTTRLIKEGFVQKKGLLVSVLLGFMVLVTGFVFSFPAATATAAAATTAAKTPFYYGVWLPFWKGQAGAQDIAINLDSLHEVSPFSYEVSSKGALIDDLQIGSGQWDGWMGAVHDSGTKIIPTIAWFDGPEMHALLSNGPKRRAQEDTIAALVKARGFDGIDIDYEGKLPETKPFFSLFIQGLGMRLHPLKKTVSCTILPRTPVSSLYASNPLPDVQYSDDYVALNKYCDEVRVMAYDQGTLDLKLDTSKGDGTLYAPTADLAWVEKVIQETIKTISPKKIMLGIPTYGYEYQVSWLSGATTYERVRSFTFDQAMGRADSLGISPFRNNAGELSFTFASTTHINNVAPALTTIIASAVPTVLAVPNPVASTTFFVSFSDAKSTADKIVLAKKYGLRGAVLFKADGEIDPATWGLMH